MTASILHLPERGFAPARATLRSGTASSDQITAACDALASSPDKQDAELVRQMRWTLPLTVAACEAIAVEISSKKPRESFDEAVHVSVPRPTMTPRRHPGLTSFLLGFLALLVALFLITVFSEHIQARAAETVAQGIAKRAM